MTVLSSEESLDSTFLSGKLSQLREVVNGLTDASLAADTEPVEGEGSWPPPVSFPVRDCLLTILNEEWEHRLYAERDLTILEASDPAPA